MKKYMLLAVTAVCAVSCCFAACGTVGYDDLNDKLDLNYSAITLTVTDKYDEDTSLTSNYHMTFSDDKVTINYNIQRFAEISLDNPSESIKESISGTTVIKDGVVMSGDIGVSGVLPDGLDFKEEYFENAKLAKTSLFADVKDASAFLGTQVTCFGMRVNAAFGDAFNSITVTYKGERGNNVQYLYQFGALA